MKDEGRATFLAAAQSGLASRLEGFVLMLLTILVARYRVFFFN